MTFVQQNRKPYPFCPGCTHGIILDAIDAALEGSGKDPKRTVLVSDIGCVGLADRYFDCHTFHGLHGRSFTYASGIKLANPELEVFVLVGDGGCGIGGHHLINAARRNIGIKVICFDNFNFGMTGGEHSVTTPEFGKTHTTPLGNIERSFDLANLVSAAGATFVARKCAFDKDLPQILTRLFNHTGFGFIDILEICSAYYMPLNEFKKPALDKMVAELRLTMGVIREENLPEYSARLREAWPKEAVMILKPKGVQPSFKPIIKDGSFSVMIAGSAGMKVVSAATNLARAGLKSGLFASQEDDYPVTVQTGHSLSVVKLGAQKIHYPGVARPDAVLVISEDGLKVCKKILAVLSKEATVIAPQGLEGIETEAAVLRFESPRSKTSITTAVIAMLLHIKKVLPPEAFKAVLESMPGEKIRNENLDAFAAGIKMYNAIKEEIA